MNFVLLLAFLAIVSAAYAQYDASLVNDSASSCVCTTVPCPVNGYNYLSVGGGTASGTYYYATHGSYPVVINATATIYPSGLDKGSDTTSCTQSYSRMLDDDGIQDCDAGHILANRLGGPGNQPINIFPQDLSINRGAYRTFEDSIYTCLTGGASSAKLSWKFIYSSNTQTKPVNVQYTAKFTGGNCSDKYQEFTN